MALFGKKNNNRDTTNLNSENIIKNPTVGSKISRCMVIDGPIRSCEPITIDGKVNGQIECDDCVVISHGAFVSGKIFAKEVIVDGIVEAPIEADSVVVSKNGLLTGYIIATDVVIEGKSDGDILAKETLIVKNGADVTTVEVKTQIATIEGEISGTIIASEIVDLKSSATVDGDIYTDDIQRTKGATLLGSINRYNEYIELEASNS